MNYRIKRFYRKIKNILSWMPILWENYEWDYVYLLKIIKKKLELMEDFYLHSEQAYSLDSEKTADDIREAIAILDRMIECDYLSVALEKFDEKYPDYEWGKFDTKPVEGRTDAVEWVNDMTEEQQKLFRECGKISDDMENLDYEAFFNYLKNRLRFWWD